MLSSWFISTILTSILLILLCILSVASRNPSHHETSAVTSADDLDSSGSALKMKSSHGRSSEDENSQRSLDRWHDRLLVVALLHSAAIYMMHALLVIEIPLWFGVLLQGANFGAVFIAHHTWKTP